MYCCAYSHRADVVCLAFSCPSLICEDDSHMYADLHINTVTRSTCIHTSTLHYFLWHESNHANVHSSQGQYRLKKATTTIKAQISWSCLDRRLSTRMFSPPPPSCFSVYPSLGFLFLFDNGPHLSCHHWQHCKSKLGEDWEKLASSDLWNHPNYWYKCKIHCER